LTTLLSVAIDSSRYGQVEALRDVAIEVNEGEIVAVLGGNGAGKTTLLRTISGVLVKGEATIKLEGQDVSKLRAPARVHAGLVHVPEGRRPFRDLTVAENLKVAAFAQKLPTDEADAGREKVCTLFPILKERWDQKAASLSGGEQQMLAIGRGLLSRPRVLMVDEASLGLAPIMVSEVLGALSRLRDEGLAILLVEQNATAALDIAARAYILERGTVALSASAAALKNDERVASAYLGGSGHDFMQTGALDAPTTKQQV
jgi:branched-chain amino acid transport system ATP-binding protein